MHKLTFAKTLIVFRADIQAALTQETHYNCHVYAGCPGNINSVAAGVVIYIITHQRERCLIALAAFGTEVASGEINEKAAA